ncbi:MAG: hypothetical protein MUF25_00100, partial [Pirellulaceae bacterium]|nr:hypothetical protein [Pirellulaceae bacterium]
MLMSVVTREVPRLRLAPHSSGVSLTPEEFDAVEFEEGWRYALIQTPEPVAFLLEQKPHSSATPMPSTLAERQPPPATRSSCRIVRRGN